PHAVRVGVALIDGKLWSSGTQGRLRTKLLRRDPRCTFFLWEAGFGFLTVEGKVTILEGPDVPDQSVRLFQTMQPNAPPGHLSWYGKQLTLDQFRQAMLDEQRLIYELSIERAYGLITS